MVLWSAPTERHIMVCTIPLYWRKERGNEWLEVIMASLGKI